MIVRFNEPIEALSTKDIKHHHWGKCHYCKSTDGEPGVVKMLREQKSPYRLCPNKCYCLACGQRYTLSKDAYEAYLGCVPPEDHMELTGWPDVEDEQ